MIAYVRDAKSVDPELTKHQNLVLIQGAFSDKQAVYDAISKYKPQAIFSMVTSDNKPHDAISSSATAAVSAVQSIIKQQQDSKDNSYAIGRVRYIPILGYASPLIDEEKQPWFDRKLLSVASFFYSGSSVDMVRAADLLKSQSDLKYTLLLPSVLTNGPRTEKYFASDVEAPDFQQTASSPPQRAWSSISRANLAHYCVSLGEQIAASFDDPSADLQLPRLVTMQEP